MPKGIISSLLPKPHTPYRIPILKMDNCFRHNDKTLKYMTFLLPLLLGEGWGEVSFLLIFNYQLSIDSVPKGTPYILFIILAKNIIFLKA